MKFPNKGELIRVFNSAYPDGKLRYFYGESPDQYSPIEVLADGATIKTYDGTEYWDTWEYPDADPKCKICKGEGTFSYHGHIMKCSCLTEPRKITSTVSGDLSEPLPPSFQVNSLNDYKKKGIDCCNRECEFFTADYVFNCAYENKLSNKPDYDFCGYIPYNQNTISGDVEDLPDPVGEINDKINGLINIDPPGETVPDLDQLNEKIFNSLEITTISTIDLSNNPSEAPKNDSIEDKLDLSLIPYDLLNELLLPCYEEGLNEYYRDSWRMGFPIMKIFAATLRHLFKFIFKHEDYDIESLKKYNIKKHHLGAVIVNCLFMYNSLKVNPEKFDDRRS